MMLGAPGAVRIPCRSEHAALPTKVPALQAALIVGVCGGYLAASSILILLNKFLLSTDGFSFPLMLSGSGMAMTYLGSSVLVRIPAIVPARQVRSARGLPGPHTCCRSCVHSVSRHVAGLTT